MFQRCTVVETPGAYATKLFTIEQTKKSWFDVIKLSNYHFLVATKFVAMKKGIEENLFCRSKGFFS